MHTRRTQLDRARRDGFSLVELLVVVVIIVLVIGIVAVSGANVIAAGRKAATERLLSSITTAIEQFHADHGFYPPLLTHHASDPGHLSVADVQPNAFTQTANDPMRAARYHSVYSLGAYLVGIGDLRGDGVVDGYAFETPPRPNLDDGVDGPGIRSPGPDRAWGGAANGLSLTNTAYMPPTTGRVYGPYIDVKPGRAMRQVERRAPIRVDVVQTINGSSVSDTDVNWRRRFTIIDRWGNPIRYYSGWPTRDDMSGDYSLLNVPIELFSYDAASIYAARTNSAENTIPPRADGLMGAPYALLSAGEDGYFGEASNERANITYPANAMFINAGNLGLGLGVFGDDETGRRAQERHLRRLSDNIRVLP